MPSRRALLLAGVAAAGAAAAGTAAAAVGWLADGALRPRRPPDRDERVRARARSGEQALLAAYDAVLAARSDLRARLGPLRAHHVAHLTALGGRSTAPRSRATSPPAASPPVPDLAGLERRAAADRLADCLAAADPALARLLASIGAAEATHAAWLPASVAGFDR